MNDRLTGSQERVDLLATIAELCERYPHWRLGQLIANVAGGADQEIWDAEDQQLLAAARSHLAQLAPRETVGAGRVNRGVGPGPHARFARHHGPAVGVNLLADECVASEVVARLRADGHAVEVAAGLGRT